MRNKYTNEDIEFLKKYYTIGDWDSILKRFPNSTKNQIYNICHKRGISANYNQRDKSLKTDSYRKGVENRTRWNELEISILINNYSKMSIEDLMSLLPNRTYDAITLKAKKLKLKSYFRTLQLYSDEDLNYISKNWEFTSDLEMSKKLHRTQRAIKAMRNQMGFFRQNKEKLHYGDLIKFFRGRIYEWKKNSMEACNFQCILTGNKEFAIHHLISFNVIVRNFLSDNHIILKESFDDYSLNELEELSNLFISYHNQYPLGVCIDINLHMKFHSIYGDINNENQWQDFVEKYKKGEYCTNT